jgi:peptidoglycan/LPS O-acetylase OafA/YrhL
VALTQQHVSAPSRNSGAVPGFIPALDGLRCTAIISVLLFHLGIPKLSLGWAGVELFFVISGFLITRILLSTRGEPDYFTRFYYRRTLRIFPIYYLVVIAYTFAAVSKGGSGFHTLPFYYAYLQTIPQLQSQFTDLPALGHTWSLAIEEQFYLVWPMAVWVLRGRRLLWAIAAMIVIGPGLRILALAFANPFLVDGWLGVQIDCLAAGACVAYASVFLSREMIRRWATAAFLLGVISLAVLVGSVGTAVFWTPLIWCRMWYAPLVISAMACGFSGLVGLVAVGCRWTQWLEYRPLMRIGKISYGIYLYHPFVFAAVQVLAQQVFHQKSRLVSGGVILTKLSATWLAAWISWRLIEGPINALKDRRLDWSGISAKRLTQREGVVGAVDTAGR